MHRIALLFLFFPPKECKLYNYNKVLGSELVIFLLELRLQMVSNHLIFKSTHLDPSTSNSYQSTFLIELCLPHILCMCVCSISIGVN